jgi:hypothetical protein
MQRRTRVTRYGSFVGRGSQATGRHQSNRERRGFSHRFNKQKFGLVSKSDRHVPFIESVKKQLKKVPEFESILGSQLMHPL